MKRQISPTASKYRRRTRREFGGETVEYIIVILAVVVIGGGLMGFGNQVSGQIGKTGNSISSWFGKANGTGDNASVLETGPRVLSKNSAPAHLCLSQVYRDRTSIAR